jgi:hypothetical protein
MISQIDERMNFALSHKTQWVIPGDDIIAGEVFVKRNNRSKS